MKNSRGFTVNLTENPGGSTSKENRNPQEGERVQIFSEKAHFAVLLHPHTHGQSFHTHMSFSCIGGKDRLLIDNKNKYLILSSLYLYSPFGNKNNNNNILYSVIEGFGARK